MSSSIRPGPFLLYSTTLDGSQYAVVAHVRSQSSDRSICRLLVLQTPLESPSEDEATRLETQFSDHGMSVQAVDAGLQTREDAADQYVLDRITEADAILATGGDPERMVRVLRDTPALDALRAAHRRGAVVGGGSAGAMVFGAGYLGGSREHRQPVALLNWLPSLVIAPHFGMYPIGPWQEAWPDTAILGLPDQAVVLVNGRQIASCGRVPAEIIGHTGDLFLNYVPSAPVDDGATGM